MRVNTITGTTKSEQGAANITSVKWTRAGFTIVETLIVLAVTGTLFVSVVTLVSGRQGKAEFTQSINNVKSQLDQTINEVSSGYYPATGDFVCQGTAGTISITAPGATPASQGASNGCIFLGKVIHFYGNAATGPDPEQAFTYVVAGLQFQAGGDVTTAITNASPKLVAKSPSSPVGFPTVSVDMASLTYGLRTQSMTYVDGTGISHPIGSFGLISTLGAYDANNNLQSGSGTVDLLPIAGGSLGNDSGTEITQTNQFFSTTLTPGNLNNYLNPDGGVNICFSSGSTTESGLITIGSNGRELSTSLKRFNTTNCT